MLRAISIGRRATLGFAAMGVLLVLLGVFALLKLPDLRGQPGAVAPGGGSQCDGDALRDLTRKLPQLAPAGELPRMTNSRHSRERGTRLHREQRLRWPEGE